MRGQTSIPEFIITLSMFLILFILLTSLSRQALPQPLDTADSIANIILQDGVPPDWNTSTVIIPGILTQQRLNLTKLLLIQTLNTSILERISTQPFSITLTLPNGTSIMINTSPLPTSPAYQSITQRAVIVNHTITTLTITTWKE